MATALATAPANAFVFTRCDESRTALLASSQHNGDEPVMSRRNMMISASVATIVTGMAFSPLLRPFAIEGSNKVSSIDFQNIIDRIEAGEPNEAKLHSDVKELRPVLC